MLVTPQGGMPTLAAAAGAPQPESVAIDGVDLLPLVTVDGAPGGPPGELPRAAVSVDCSNAGDDW